MHSHLLPGIDDGCATVLESLDSIRTLIEHGYRTTVCTPHLWELYPANTPTHIAAWVAALRQEIESAGLDYTLYTGGELRLSPKVIDWMQAHGVPTLADSKFVLCDFWENKWPKWADRAFDWMLTQGYTPILAHPERSAGPKDYDKHLNHWATNGVIFQGNLQCFTGEAGYRADTLIRQYLEEDRYTLLALDMHRPDTLAGRLGGIGIAKQEFGEERVETMIDAARTLLWPNVGER